MAGSVGSQGKKNTWSNLPQLYGTKVVTRTNIYASKKIHIIWKAYDAPLYLSGENPVNMIHSANIDPDAIYKWYISNKLSVNIL